VRERGRKFNNDYVNGSDMSNEPKKVVPQTNSSEAEPGRSSPED
jgi:hypothetical protein